MRRRDAWGVQVFGNFRIFGAAFRMFSAKRRGVPFNVFNSPRDTPAPRFPWQPARLKRVSEVGRMVRKRGRKK